MLDVRCLSFSIFIAFILPRGVGHRLYRFPDVIHRLQMSVPPSSSLQSVNNVVRAEDGETGANLYYLGRAAVRITKAARWTSFGQFFDRSSDPDSDTNTQVSTLARLIYTAFAPSLSSR